MSEDKKKEMKIGRRALRERHIVLAVFILALLPRVLNLDAFITWDEPMWAYRSIKFLTALRRMDFGGTFQVGHPGVITMWAGATGISIQRLLGFPPFPPTLGGQGGDLAWLSNLSPLDPRDTEALRKLAPFLSAAKLPAVVLHAACIVGIYLLAKRLFDSRTSLLAALLLALDPFHLALSRVLHIDALAADFMILSTLSLLVHLRQFDRRRSPDLDRRRSPDLDRRRSPDLDRRRSPDLDRRRSPDLDRRRSPDLDRRRSPDRGAKGSVSRPSPIAGRLYLLLSGAFAALAALSKSYALFLAPFAGLVLAAAYLVKERNLRQVIPSVLGSFAIWCLAAALTFFLLWPAVWVDPLGAIRGVLDTAFGFAAASGATSELFLEQTTADPGIWYYPVALAFRTTPLVLIGLVMASLQIFVKRENVKREMAIILAYACLFTILMTLGAKKFDRYMLPVILALDIVAAWGLVGLGKLLGQYTRKRSESHQLWILDIGYWVLGIGVWGLLLLVQAGHVISYHPYYLSYYNPLLGGLSKAVETLPVGWGEGMDLAAGYLNQKEDAPDLRVATGGIPGFAPLFKGQTEGLTEHNLATADYAVLYISDVQQDSPAAAALYEQQQPEHVVNIHGADYAWIYRNTHYQELIALLDSQAQKDDIILLDAASPFGKHYQGPLTYYVISDSQSWSEVAKRLADSTEPQRLWYVAYPGSNEGSWISFQLNTHALLLDPKALPHATVFAYLLTTPLALDSSPIQVQTNVNFGDRLLLTGYGFTGDTIEYRQQLGITLRWQTIAEMQRDYALSLRLVDEQGRRWGQADEWLENESALPTYAWKAGQVTERHHALALDAGAPPGSYQVKLVVYSVSTLEALTILDEGGSPAGTEYTLGTISVASPSTPPTIEELAIPHHLRHDFGGQVELLGYDLSTAEVKAGEAVRVVLFWRALHSMQSDYRLHLQAQDNEGNTWAGDEFPLANESYPTNRWSEGEIIKGQYDLTVDAAAPTGEFPLRVNLLDKASGLPVEREGIVLTMLSVAAPKRLFTVPTEIQHPLQANLADKVTFLGYDLDKAAVKPGGTLRLTLYWQSMARMETSYTVFVHLLDAQNRTWGQRDNLPVGGAYPTTGWLPGEVVRDEYEIVVDAAAPAGRYQIEVGMYNAGTMLRLPAFDEQGNPLPSDRILLGEVQMK